MKINTSYGIYVLAAALSCGCGHENRKASQKVEKTGQPPSAEEVIVVKNPLNVVRNSLLGTWAKPCDNGMKTAIIVDARVFAKTYLFYEDKECSKVKYTIQFGGEYQLNNQDAKASNHDFDAALQFAVMKVYDEADAADFNHNQLFGYTDWDTHKAKNIIDKGFKSDLLNPREMKATLLFSRFIAEGDALWMADFAVQKDQRAAQIQADDVYHKLK